MSERLFPLPDEESARLTARLRRLPPAVADLVHATADALDHDRLDAAACLLAQLRAQAPEQPDALRLGGLIAAQRGDFATAFAQFERALRVLPGDLLVLDAYANARAAAGDITTALALREQACALAPDSAFAAYGLGQLLARDARMVEARAPLERAAALAPDFAPAHLELGNAYVYLGRINDAAAEYRAALRCDPTLGAAWYSLANIKTLRLTDAETAHLGELLERTDLIEADRIEMLFALGKACEDAGRYAEAFARLVEANARKRRQMPWQAAAFSAHARRVEAAFAAPHARVADPRFGHEAIFIVGMPRSGSTLTEQILAAHSQVEGAGELHEMEHVLGAESARRRQRFPDWVAQASSQDWQRLGRQYLDRTARWRAQRPRFTDKLPDNWLFTGAIMAMLPGARVILCTRDALETCWSCFKQSFARGSAFSYAFDDLAAYHQDVERATRAWRQAYPQAVYEQVYENLIRDPQTQTRALLDFCGLPFEESCLRPHQSARVVRTASAAQVRQALRADTSRAACYGALLDPLRALLNRREPRA